MPLKIRFAPALAYALIGVGAAVLVLGLAVVLPSDGGGGVGLAAAGLVLGLLGVGYLGPIPYAVVADTAIIMPMALGPGRMVYEGYLHTLRIIDGKLYDAPSESSRRRIWLVRGFARREDWDAFAAHLDTVRDDRP